MNGSIRTTLRQWQSLAGRQFEPIRRRSHSDDWTPERVRSEMERERTRSRRARRLAGAVA